MKSLSKHPHFQKYSLGILLTAMPLIMILGFTSTEKPKDDTFKELWAKVEQFEKEGLPKSALEIIEIIIEKARKEQHPQQTYKAFVYKFKFELQTHENGYIHSLNALKAEIEKSTSPIKELFQSLYAEVLWKYYRQNRWTISDRTYTSSSAADDIETWDSRRFIEEIRTYYLLSVEPISLLQSIKTIEYEDLIIFPEEEIRFRTTLFDILAHRALEFLSNSEAFIDTHSDTFVIDKSDYFDDATDFSKMSIQTQDEFSPLYKASLLYQQLIELHYANQTIKSLVDVDILRLKFIREHAIIINKDSLYYAALLNLQNQYALNEAITVINYEIAQFLMTKGNLYNHYHAPQHQWDLSKALKLAKQTITHFPNAYGTHNLSELIKEIEFRSFSFQCERYVSHGKPILLRINYRNIDKLHYKIIDAKGFHDESQLRNLNDSNKLKLFNKYKPILSGSVQLSNEHDFQEHSTEIVLDELPVGTFLLMLSPSEDFHWNENKVDFMFFQATHLSYVSQSNSDDSHSFYVLNRESGSPLSKIKADVFQYEYNYRTRKYESNKINSSLTDNNGEIQIPPTKKYRNIYVVFSQNKDTLRSSKNYYQYERYPATKKKEVRTVFFTDRAIYRPGQTLYFKGLLIETDGETSTIKPNFSTTVTLYDVNYEKVHEIHVKSNEFGTFNGTFILPETGLTGQMSIADKYGRQFFSVEEYKRPTFEVVFPKTEEYFKLNQLIEVKGNVKAYAGFPIDGARVQYRVVRQMYYPFRKYWMWYPPVTSETIIDYGTVVTDNNGDFQLSFTAAPDLQSNKTFSPAFVFTIYADVTDISGETRSNSQSLHIGYTAMLLSTNLGEFLNAQDVNEIEIYSTNLSGTAIGTNVNIEIFQIQPPQSYFISRLWDAPDRPLISESDFKQKFPNLPFQNEDRLDNWKKKQKQLKTTIHTTEKQKLVIPDLPKWNTGVYQIVLTSTDPFGETVEYEHYFLLFQAKNKKAEYNSPLWIVPQKTKGEPGEHAIFHVGSSASNANILVCIEHKQNIISKNWYQVGNNFKTIEIPIEEKHRGGFHVHVLMTHNNRTYIESNSVQVPHTNKEIDIRFETFRNKLQPGEQETWNIVLKGAKGEKVMAEMLAVLYDASLDAFRKHSWSLMLHYTDYASSYFSASESFGSSSGIGISYKWNPPIQFKFLQYEILQTYGFPDMFGWGYFGKNRGSRVMAQTLMMTGNARDERSDLDDQTVDKAEYEKVLESDIISTPQTRANENLQLDNVIARQNFNETAFFYPDLRTNDKGEIMISFTLPESLTKWRMLGLAHTKDLKVGHVMKELVAQKELMVIPNMPRFFREGDTLTLVSKITNLSETLQQGKAKLVLLDALTLKPVDSNFNNLSAEKDFSADAGASTTVSWDIIIPFGMQAVTCRIIAATETFSDGEEHVLPILTNNILLTESMPLPIRSGQTKQFTHTKLLNSASSNTIRHHKLTLEFSANPAWYAVQALPYMMEYPYDCAEQIFTRLYANTLANHIIKSKPQIRRVFEAWKNSPKSESLISNLEKNQELKQILLEETPWVMQAKDETERKRRIAMLFDMNTMSREYEKALRQLENMQKPGGGWAWFDGFPVDRYITQHIISGFGHLAHLKVIDINENKRLRSIIISAIGFLDEEIQRDYTELKKLHSSNEITKLKPSVIAIHYLYTRSFFLNDFEIPSSAKEAIDYYKNQSAKYWLNSGLYSEGMIALALHRMGEKEIPQKILKSLKERAIIHDELGMYWKENQSGYSWWQAHVETQSLLIEAFYEISNDISVVDNLKTWLLKQKQVQDWKTTKATASAIYAILLTGTDWLSVESNISITVGDEAIDIENNAEPGTGYFKTSWHADKIQPNMGKVEVKKYDEGVSWGALYWQYFEHLDKVTNHETPISIRKKLFIERITPKGKELELIENGGNIRIGEKVIVRIEIRVDRDMEYVHMKDMRASGFEPLNVLSQYKWQDGLGYYESTRDAASNFFMNYLRKGTYVFEYPLRATLAGKFSNGITTIQCMYAPEFTSHSGGIRLEIVGN